MDVACGGGGPGLWAASQSGATLVGVDPADAGLSMARERADAVGLCIVVRFQRGTFEQTGLPDAIAGSVMMIEAFQYAPVVAMIVEADEDMAVRKVMTRATHRMEAALAAALGGDHTADRARRVLIAVWAGLYSFLMRPRPRRIQHAWFLSWLEGSSRSRQERRSAAATRK